MHANPLGVNELKTRARVWNGGSPCQARAEAAWTLILSNWHVQKAFNPDDTTALSGWGVYTPDKDVLRARSPSGSRLVCLRNR